MEREERIEKRKKAALDKLKENWEDLLKQTTNYHGFVKELSMKISTPSELIKKKYVLC